MLLTLPWLFMGSFISLNELKLRDKIHNFKIFLTLFHILFLLFSEATLKGL